MPTPAPHIKSLTITPGRRFETGCIATFNDGSVRHFVGVNSEATRAAAEFCDKNGVKIVSLSTPYTIYRDIQGTRSELEEVDSNIPRNTLRLPEESMLGNIGRMDLLQPHSGKRSGAIMDARSR